MVDGISPQQYTYPGNGVNPADPTQGGQTPTQPLSPSASAARDSMVASGSQLQTAAQGLNEVLNTQAALLGIDTSLAPVDQREQLQQVMNNNPELAAAARQAIDAAAATAAAASSQFHRDLMQYINTVGPEGAAFAIPLVAQFVDSTLSGSAGSAMNTDSWVALANQTAQYADDELRALGQTPSQAPVYFDPNVNPLW